MASTLLAAFAIAAAAAAAAAALREAPPPGRAATELHGLRDSQSSRGLQLEESWSAEDRQSEIPDVRNWKERRGAAASRALSWLDAPLDDRELAAFVSAGKDPAAPGEAQGEGPIMADGASVVWRRPSLLTLGHSPGQPDSADWLRWQAAIDRGRARAQAAAVAAAEPAAPPPPP